MNTAALYRDRTPQLSPPGRCWAILLAVIAVHVLAVMLPYLRSLRTPEVRENKFKVKLGADKPSHDVNVGKPERLRPTGGEPAAPAPEPQLKLPPKPRPKAEPQLKLPPKPRPKAEPRLKLPPKPRPKAEPQLKLPPKPPRQKAEPKVSQSAGMKRSSASTDNRNRRDSRQTATGKSGGKNYNNTVPIGSRDAGQRFGKPDHRTPQGGLTEADEAYYNRLKRILDFRWKEPSRTLLGDLRPQTTIELEISADGRVLSSRIVKPSGNVSMDESVRRLLKALDLVPAPPNGAMTIHVNMVVK